MSNSLPKVIFFPIHLTSWPTMFQLALKLKKEGKYQPVMLLTTTIIQHLETCQSEGLEVYLFNSDLLYQDSSKSLKNQPVVLNKEKFSKKFLNISLKFVKRLYLLLRNSFNFLEKITARKILTISLYNLLRLPIEIIYLEKFKKVSERFLKQIKPLAIYMYVDNAGGNFAAFTNTCQKLGIKIIIPACAFQHEDIMSYRRQKNNFFCVEKWGSPWINRWIARRWPRQISKFENTRVLFYLPYETIAMDVCGILPKFPWVRGKSYSSILCVEDYYQEKRLIDLGLESSKVFVIGHIDCDRLWESRNVMNREDFCDQYQFDKSKKIIIIAIPQLKQEAYAETWEEHWSVIETIVKAATDTGENVLLALHPKFLKEDYLFLEKKYPCKLNQGSKTSDILPFGDIYVAAASSTNFWAIQCGLIVVDYYGAILLNEKNTLMSYLKSIINVNTYQDLSLMLKRLIKEQDYFLFQKNLVIEDQKNYFPIIDGNNVQKYVDLIDKQYLQSDVKEKNHASC